MISDLFESCKVICQIPPLWCNLLDVAQLAFIVTVIIFMIIIIIIQLRKRKYKEEDKI